MSNVSIYVALISAGAGVFGAAIPQAAIVVREVRQAGRDREERRSEKRRQACLDLLQAAASLRTGVADAADYHGDEMGIRLAGIRNCAAAVQVNSLSVGMLPHEVLRDPAERLAAAAATLAEAAARDTNLSLGQMAVRPEFRPLDEAMEAFRQTAMHTQ